MYKINLEKSWAMIKRLFRSAKPAFLTKNEFVKRNRIFIFIEAFEDSKGSDVKLL